MPTCQYVEWDKRVKGLFPCGAAAETINVSGFARGRLGGQNTVTLCAAHKEFVLDCLDRYQLDVHKIAKKQRSAELRTKIKQLQAELKTQRSAELRAKIKQLQAELKEGPDVEI